MISRYFINRPVLTIVGAIIIVLLGILSINELPISQFPRITPPTVVVSAKYPGADAQTIANNVLSPIEAEIAGAEGLTYSSGSASGISGSASITATFDIGTNQDLAAIDIQNRVNLASPFLPQAVRDLGINVQKRTNDILMMAAFYSPDGSMNSVQISNYLSTHVLDMIKQIPGAGQSRIFAQRDYAIRLWLDPDKMASRGITTGDISAAVKEQNLQVSPGRLGQAPSPKEQTLTVMLTAEGRLKEPEQFGNIIIKATPEGNIIRLRDVARIELGSSDYEFFGRVNGKQAANIGIFTDTKANALETAEAVKAKLAQVAKNFPPGLAYTVPYDTADFVKISIEEVVKTLFEAIILVAFVVYFFLQSWRAAIIPILAVPVSLMGAFIGMSLLGYSINTLTLFGLVLAIGIVVDDAIVVVENMERILQTEHLSPKDAALKAMKQVSGPVISIVLVLCAVFIPAAFVGGMTGELYKQFAITIAVSVVFSGIVALTLSPVLGTLLLKNTPHTPWAFFHWFNARFEAMTTRYTTISAWMIKRFFIALLVYLGAYVLIFVFNKTTPQTFLPSEDQGYFINVATLPEGATIERTTEVVKKVEMLAAANPAVAYYTALVGWNLINGQQEPHSATIFMRLKSWDERKSPAMSAQSVVGQMNKAYASIVEASVVAMPPPPLRGLGVSNMFQFRLLQPGDANMSKLASTTGEFLGALRANSALVNPLSPMRPLSPVLAVDVDREHAKMLGVSIADIFQTLQGTIGITNVNQFDRNGRTYWVQMQADASFRTKPEDITRGWVRSSNGKMVPLSSLVSVRFVSAPARIDHFNGMLSTLVMASPAANVSSTEAIAHVENTAESLRNKGILGSWEGLYYQEKLVGSKSFVMIAFALLMVYLILAASYGKWILPLSIMLAVPFGVMGAYVAVGLAGLTNNVYFQIGLLTLIGLSAKNAILVVEFAEEKRREGFPLYEATMEAARLRYRPMMMTSMAFVLGVLPLVFSSGAGAASRISIGMGMVGGMLCATFIERYFIPYLYYGVAYMQERLKGKHETL